MCKLVMVNPIKQLNQLPVCIKKDEEACPPKRKCILAAEQKIKLELNFVFTTLIEPTYPTPYLRVSMALKNAFDGTFRPISGVICDGRTA